MNIQVIPYEICPFIRQTITDIQAIDLPIDHNLSSIENKSSAMNSFINEYCRIHNLVISARHLLLYDWNQIIECVSTFINADYYLAYGVINPLCNSAINNDTRADEYSSMASTDLKIAIPDYEISNAYIDALIETMSSGLSEITNALMKYREDIDAFWNMYSFSGEAAIRIKKYIHVLHRDIVDKILNLAEAFTICMHNYSSEYVYGMGENGIFLFNKIKLLQVIESLRRINISFLNSASDAEEIVEYASGLPTVRSTTIDWISLSLSQEKEICSNSVSTCCYRIESLMNIICEIEGRYAVVLDTEIDEFLSSILLKVNSSGLSVITDSGNVNVQFPQNICDVNESLVVEECPVSDKENAVSYWLNRLICDEGTIDEGTITECYNTLVLVGVITNEVSVDALRAYPNVIEQLGYDSTDINEIFLYLLSHCPDRLVSLYCGNIEEITNEISEAERSMTINRAIRFAFNIANDDSHHGYDGVQRWGPGYDCSAFVISAYESAGVNMRSIGINATGSMNETLMSEAGFSLMHISSMEDLQPGDILVWDNGERGHTIMIVSEGENGSPYAAAAHSNYDGISGDSSGNEISIYRLGNGEFGNYTMIYRYMT